MSEQEKYNKSRGDRDPLDLFDGASVKWNRSKEDVWASLENKLEEKDPARIIGINPRRRIFAAAALIIILLGIPSIMRFYSRTVCTPAGEHTGVSLPDGSLVSLNAESTVKYNPLWWNFKREVRLEGEAFFKVEPGSHFEVISEYASTAVVGTSFNILSRDERYEVTCVTGKVKVRSYVSDAEILLSPDQRALLGSGGKLVKEEINKTANTISWIDKQFYFTAVPLEQVFEEVERQFNIDIRLKISEGLTYTGNFSLEKDPESALRIICKPFGIKFEALSEGVYLVSEDE